MVIGEGKVVKGREWREGGSVVTTDLDLLLSCSLIFTTTSIQYSTMLCQWDLHNMYSTSLCLHISIRSSSANSSLVSQEVIGSAVKMTYLQVL